ncbi:hypothetical protein BDW22DRAFT_1403007 [Trametopsis cervina]|nr:hypothetical protein BDW22DRAFT_1403007 [Trametopsis cervina]
MSNAPRARETNAVPGDEQPQTNYGAFVTKVVAHMTRTSGSMDQQVLQRCLGLASSYLVTDTTMNPDSGLVSWQHGFNRLVDVIVALNARGELQVETVSAASKACSECWSVAGTWREVEISREGVRDIAKRLKSILDENGRTYNGERIYVP